MGGYKYWAWCWDLPSNRHLRHLQRVPSFSPTHRAETDSFGQQLSLGAQADKEADMLVLCAQNQGQNFEPK